jgi:hypothetical protein
VLLLERKARRGLTAALALSLSTAPIELQAAAVATIARVALLKIRLLARRSAEALIETPYSIPELSARGVSYSVAFDSQAAAKAADRLAHRWSMALRDGLTDAGARAELSSAANLTASYEAVSALNEEVSRIGLAAHASGLTVIETWNAKLSKGTCETCEGLDNEERTLPDTFDDRPPLHPNCNCAVMTEIS